MANTIRIKRSAVASKVPLTTDLQLGELAINTFDGKLYTKKDNGTASIVEIGAAASGVTSFSAGTTGLTPSTGTTGAITLAGTLAVANGGTGVTTSTGTGSTVLSTSPTLVTPLLGTPTSGTLTNCTGYTFANIASKPTTLAGYGITDAAASNQTMFIGTTSVAINRTSANLALTGISSVAFPGSTSGTATLQATATAGTPTLSLPITTGTLIGSGDTGTVSTTMIAGSAVTYAKIQNVSATDKLLGRSTAGAGVVEEITCTAAGRALLDDTDAAAQRTTLSAAQAGAGGAIVETAKTISANYTITTNYNGVTAGPVTINSGVTVTIPSGSSWVIV